MPGEGVEIDVSTFDRKGQTAWHPESEPEPMPPGGVATATLKASRTEQTQGG